MTARKAAAIAALLLALIGTTAGKCDLEKKAPAKGGAPTSAAPKAAPAVPPVKPPKTPGNAEPAPVQGDPSAHNQEPGEVDLYVEWTSENKFTPACEWSKNAPGQGHPCEGIKEAAKPKGSLDYIGLWSRTEMGKAGDLFEISAQGAGGVKSIDCSIMFKNEVHVGTTDGKRCSISIRLG